MSSRELLKTAWIGKRFGRLTVVEVLKDRRARCLCDCGRQVVVWRNNLKRPNTRSCGCLRKEMYESGRAFKRHGHTADYGKTRIYRIWTNMKTRCGNLNASNYQYYGGRGIGVCKKWSESFEAFLSDMGDPPSSKHTIDRINVEGHYMPGNCRWATMKEQCENRAKRGTRQRAPV